jgi:hypothetical protein
MKPSSPARLVLRLTTVVILALTLAALHTAPALAQYTLTGRIVRSTDATLGVAGVPVRNTNTGQVVTTDSTGFYTFVELRNGQYCLYPLLPGLEFEPLVRIVKVLDEDVNASDFSAEEATYSIHGKIIYEKSPSQGVAGVTIYVADSAKVELTNVTTDDTGYFRVKNLKLNQQYQLLPLMADMETKNIKIIPPKLQVMITGAITRQNFSVGGNVEVPER